MSNTSTTPVGPAAALRGSPMALAVTSIREFLAFKLGSYHLLAVGFIQERMPMDRKITSFTKDN